jgi:hypothetical protein
MPHGKHPALLIFCPIGQGPWIERFVPGLGDDVWFPVAGFKAYGQPTNTQPLVRISCDLRN